MADRTARFRRIAMAVALASAALPWSAGTAAAEPTTVALPACYGTNTPPVERPSQAIFQTCADGSKELTGLTWNTWAPGGANGTGTYSYQVCEPNCAAGHRVQFPVVVHADEPVPASATSGCPAGTDFFANLVLAYPEGVPPANESPINSRFRGMPATLYSTVGSGDSGFWLGNVTCR